ncbi:hypothetical protein BJY04DRAFT_202125 [Aspergillus karnatakaensis]|uniref:uncharacterized protein n=1 Tax=Aspergillus karnatakaensis TaxID=1810916 RepID=UPI003CCCC450
MYPGQIVQATTNKMGHCVVSYHCFGIAGFYLRVAAKLSHMRFLDLSRLVVTRFLKSRWYPAG